MYDELSSFERRIAQSVPIDNLDGSPPHQPAMSEDSDDNVINRCLIEPATENDIHDPPPTNYDDPAMSPVQLGGPGSPGHGNILPVPGHLELRSPSPRKNPQPTIFDQTHSPNILAVRPAVHTEQDSPRILPSPSPNINKNTKFPESLKGQAPIGYSDQVPVGSPGNQNILAMPDHLKPENRVSMSPPAAVVKGLDEVE